MSENDSSSMPRTETPPRPSPDRPTGQRLGEWLAWFGVGRLMATALCIIAVAAGGFWLVRAPAPPAEATLPTVATMSSAVPTSTMPPPTADRSPESTPTTSPDAVVVHVAGQVAVPGVYELDGARRVHDAVLAAGGPTDDADVDVLNLAQTLHDGQRVYVPSEAETEAVDRADLALVTPVEVSAPSGSVASPSGPVDLNRATVEQLDTLPGVGPSTASAIVDERDRNGPFATVDELERVPGIGPAKLEALRDLVAV